MTRFIYLGYDFDFDVSVEARPGLSEEGLKKNLLTW